MKINKFTDKKERMITYGTGMPEEVESLSQEKDFNAALETMAYIRTEQNRYI